MFNGTRIDWAAAAGWAQALMTPAAVFLAVHLADRSAERAKRKLRHQRLASLLVIYREALRLLEEVIESTQLSDKGFGPAPPPKFELENVGQALATIDPLSLDDYRLVQELFSVRRAIGSVQNSGIEPPAYLQITTTSHLGRVRGAIKYLSNLTE